MPSAHSEFPPSSMDRLIACPASWSRSKGRTRTESPVMRQGTEAHSLLERILKYQAVCFSSYPVDTRQAVDMAVDHINELREDWPGSEHIEEKVDLSYWGLPEVWGTGDYVRREYARNLTVLDYKHGEGLWVSPNCAQLKTYGAGAMGGDGSRYEEIHLTIVQPRCFKHGSELIRTHVMKPVELQKWVEDTLIPAIADAKSKSPTVNPGKKQCSWCLAKTDCREFADRALAVAKLDFKDFTPEAVQVPVLPDPVSPQELAQVFAKLPILKAWIGAIESAVYARLRAGAEVEGFKMVQGRRKRSWKNIKEAEKYLIEDCKLKLADIYPDAPLLSPAQAEKLAGTNRREIADLVNVEPGKPRVTAESDSRQAVDSAITDFTVRNKSNDRAKVNPMYDT